MPITMEMRLKNGKTLSLRKRFPYGHPMDRMQWSGVIQKFQECASRARVKVGVRAITEIIDTVQHLEDLEDVRNLNRLLTEDGLRP